MDVDLDELYGLIAFYNRQIDSIREEAIQAVVEWKYADEERLEWVPFWDQVHFEQCGNEGRPVSVEWKPQADYEHGFDSSGRLRMCRYRGASEWFFVYGEGIIDRVVAPFRGRKLYLKRFLITDGVANQAFAIGDDRITSYEWHFTGSTSAELRCRQHKLSERPEAEVTDEEDADGEDEVAPEGVTDAPDNNAEKIGRQAWKLVDAGQTKQAIELYRRALQINPDDSSARHGMRRAIKRSSTIQGILLSAIERLRGLVVYAKQVMLAAIVLYLYFGGYLGVKPVFKELQPVITYPMLALFCMWMSYWHLENLVLLTSRDGRRTLRRSEAVYGAAIGIRFAAAVAMVAIALLNFPGTTRSLEYAQAPLLLVMLITIATHLPRWFRNVMLVYAVAFGVVVTITCVKLATHSIDAAAAIEAADQINEPLDRDVKQDLNRRIADASEWSLICGYGLIAGFALFLVLRQVYHARFS